MDADGVVRVVDAAMERAVRVVTVERGVDPRDLALVAFGGAGPLHACAIADALGMRAVIVPPRAGVFSAAGLLCAPKAREVVHSFTGGSLADALARVEREARAQVGDGAVVETAVDCRYVGQSHELTVASPDDFPLAHERRNGHVRPGAPIEVIAVRARASIAAPLRITDLPAVDRPRVVGPAVVAEPDCTMWVPDGLARRAARTRRVDRGTGELMDPATLQVWISRLAGVADEMGAVLRRAAYSPNIKERADCSCAVFAPDGTLLAQAEHIPVHLGSMPAAVRAAIDACGDGLRPGDQIVVNDPFAGGTHLNDITFVAPAYADDGTLIGWAANRAHHADVGGMAPGSLPPDATEIFQEGLRIPPVRWTPGGRSARRRRVAYARGTAGRSRRPARRQPPGRRPVAGAAARERARECSARSSTTANAGRAPRSARFPTASTASTTSSTRPADRVRHAPPRICVTVTVHDDTITFDFAGTDAQRAGSVNAVEAVTVSAVVFALRSVIDPDLPANGGVLRPGARRRARRVRSSPRRCRSRSVRATSRSVSASPMCASARSRKPRPIASVARRRER